MSRLATGARIQNAGDDAAGFMISKGLEVKQRGLNTANNNIQMGMSLLGIAEGSIQTMLSPLYRIRDLALQSSNGVYSDTERKAMQMEVDSLFAEIKRTRDTAEFNGTKLFTQQIMTNKADTFVDNETAAAISLLSYTPAPTGGGTPAYSPAPMMMSVRPSAEQETEIPNATPQTTPEVSLMSIEPETQTQSSEEPVASQTPIMRSAPMMRSAAPMMMAANPNVVEGTVELDALESQTINIEGKSFNLDSLHGDTVNYSYDKTTGAITFSGNRYNIDIWCLSEQSNVILSGDNMFCYTGNGNDTITINGANCSVSDAGGDDTINVYGANAYVDGGTGINTLNLGAGATGTTQSNISKIVALDNEGSISFTSGETITLEIAGKTYEVEHWEPGTDTLNYSYDETTGAITFNGRSGFKIWSIAGQENNVIIEGTHMYFYGAEQNDKITDNGQNTYIYGGEGNDEITASGIDGWLRGEDGDDTIILYNSGNTIYGGEGNNTLVAGGDISTRNITEFNKIVALDNEGAISLEANKEVTLEIAGKTYTVMSYDGTQTLSYNYNEGTQETTFNGQYTYITSATGQENNVIIDGAYVTFYGSDANDKVKINGDTCSAYTQGGDDIITAFGVGSYVESGAGNDTINMSCEVGYAGGGDSDDVINVSGTDIAVNGGAGNDTITVNGNNNTISGGIGTNTLNIAQGVTGTNYTASEFTTINDANVPDDEPVNEGSISLASHERTNIVIAGKTYELYNWGSNPTTLDYSYDETTGAITFNSFMLEITSATGQENNVILEGTGVYYRGSDEKDTVLHKGASGYVWAEGGDDIITTEGSSAHVYGAGGNDTINSTGGYSYIYGGEGNDNITSAGDDSEISGDSGNDTINASGDYVYIYGGTDNDNITSSGSDCEIWGEGGDDTINANGNDSYIYGESGNDTINVSGLSNSIDGGSGDNTLGITGSATDVSFSTDEFSKIVALENSGSIKLNINEETTLEIAGKSYNIRNINNDSQTLTYNYDESTGIITFGGDKFEITSVAGQENNVAINGEYMTFRGSEKNDTIRITNRWSKAYGGEGADNIIIDGGENEGYGGGGNDTITVNGASHYIYGNEGNDNIILNSIGTSSIYGDEGEDIIAGNASYTYIYGGDDNDTITASGILNIEGGEGNDTIITEGNGTAVYGNNGDDTIEIAGDSNYAYGNAGDDIIEVNGNSAKVYGGDNDDRINIYGADATIDGGAGNDIFGISSSAVNPSYSNIEKIRALDNSGSLTFASGSTSVNFEIDGKEYFIWSGEAQTVNYSLENGVLTLEGNSLYIESTKDQDDNLNILGDLNEIYTFEGNDKITLSGEENTVFSGGGNDTVVANGDYSCVYTEDGNDTVTINGNNSLAELGDGDDKGTIYGDESTIGGSYGNDTMTIIGDHGRINDSEGADLITVEGDNAEIYAGKGDDLITVEGDNAEAYGEEGDDDIEVYGNDSKINGGSNNDRIYLVGDNSTALGNGGDDNITVIGDNSIGSGSIGNDTIYVKGDYSTARSLGGDDTLRYEGNYGTILGREGNNTAIVTGNYNSIELEEGNDSATILGDGNIVDCGEGYDVVSNGGTNTTISNCNELWKEPEPFVFQVGTEANANSTISVSTGFTLPVFDINISNADSARASLDDIDKMIEILTGKMAEIGVSKNRLESALSANEVTQINITAARSNIVDADIAQESMELLKAQILQNATASLLVTARDMNSNSLLNIYNSLNNLR